MKENLATPASASMCCDGEGCLNCGGSGLLTDQPLAILQHCDVAHDGPGWYYWDDEYRDEGSVGAFLLREEAEAHARAAGYRFESDGAEPEGVAVQP